MGLGCLRHQEQRYGSCSRIACERPGWLEKVEAAEVCVPDPCRAGPLEGPLSAEFLGAVRYIRGGRKRSSALISSVPLTAEQPPNQPPPRPSRCPSFGPLYVIGGR